MNKLLMGLFALVFITPVFLLAMVIAFQIVIWGRMERYDEKISWLEDMSLGHYQITKEK